MSACAPHMRCYQQICKLTLHVCGFPPPPSSSLHPAKSLPATAQLKCTANNHFIQTNNEETHSREAFPSSLTRPPKARQRQTHGLEIEFDATTSSRVDHTRLWGTLIMGRPRRWSFFHNDGMVMFFSKAPLSSMVFQWFYHPWTITIECFFADQPLKLMVFRWFSQIQVRWSAMVLTSKKT